MPIDLQSPAPVETLPWRVGRAPPALREGDLHLWRIPTSDEARHPRIDTCLKRLDNTQRKRAQGMSETVRGRYVQAQAGLRHVLGLYLDTPPAALELRYGPAGKPALASGPPGLEFNLTTAGDLALVGVSMGSPVGVDCERIRPRQGLLAIARRMFEPAMAEALHALPEELALQTFYRAWTALEADAKSDGRGLFRARPLGDQPPEIRHCIPAPGYVAAVARSRVPPLELWQTLELAPEAFG